MLFALLNCRYSKSLSLLITLDHCFPFLTVVCMIFSLFWFWAGLTITDVVTDSSFSMWRIHTNGSQFWYFVSIFFCFCNQIHLWMLSPLAYLMYYCCELQRFRRSNQWSLPVDQMVDKLSGPLSVYDRTFRHSVPVQAQFLR